MGNIFGGLSQLNLAAVGHVTAVIVAAIVGTSLVWRRRRGTCVRSTGAGSSL